MSYYGITKLKINRNITRDHYNRKCTICGADTTLVHHIDGTKINHDLDNLTLLCYSCHAHTHNKMGTGYHCFVPRNPGKFQVSLSTKIDDKLDILIRKQRAKEKLTNPKRSLAQIVAEALELYLAQAEKEGK